MSALLLFSLFSLLLTIWSFGHLRWTRMARLVNKFPGSTIFPFLGTGYMFLGPPESLLETVSNYVKRYGKRFRMWKLHNPYVVLLDPNDVEIILSSSKHINKGRDYEEMKWMNGDGLITSSGDMWREDRKILNPSFKYQRFDGFLESFNKHGKTLVKILKSTFITGNESLDIHPALCRCTMDTVFESVLGATFGIQESKSDDVGNKLYECTKMVMKAYRTRQLKPWLCLPILREFNGVAKMERDSKKYFTEAMAKVIEQRRKDLEMEACLDEDTKPFIDPLISLGRCNQNLVDHAFTIFAAGFETNATAMNFVLFLLALYPKCQDKVQEELDQVFGRENTKDASAKDLADLKYMEMCILESMRLFPPAPLLGRNLTEDVVLDDGSIIPKGADVAVFVYELHTNPKVYKNPLEFQPERFQPENVRKRHTYDYIPFSKGPRSCIGQKYAMIQLKTVLAHVLRSFRVETQTKREEVKIVYGSIVEINCQIYMSLKRRWTKDK